MTRQQVISIGRYVSTISSQQTNGTSIKPQTVIENNNTTVLWDMAVNTDKEIKANRPDIIIKNRQQKTCLMIDLTVPFEKKILASKN